MQQILIEVKPSTSLSWAWPSSAPACFWHIPKVQKNKCLVVVVIWVVIYQRHWSQFLSLHCRLCCMRRKLGKNLDQKMWTRCLTKSDEEIYSRMILKQWPGKCTPMSMVILFTILTTDQTISFTEFLTPGTINASAKKQTRRLGGNLTKLCRMLITTGKIESVRVKVRLKQKQNENSTMIINYKPFDKTLFKSIIPVDCYKKTHVLQYLQILLISDCMFFLYLRNNSC